MKARDQKRAGFIVGTGCEEGCNIGKIPAPRRSWSITPAIKMREILDCKKCTLPSCSKMSKFSLAPYSNVLWDLEQCPKSKLGLSLLVPKQPGEDRGGEEGLYDTLVHFGRRWWGCGGLEGSYLLLSFSSQLLLMKFYSSVHYLPPSRVVHPALNQAVLHTAICKKTNTDLVIYPWYI